MGFITRSLSISSRARCLLVIALGASLLFLISVAPVRAEPLGVDTPPLSPATIVALTNADRMIHGVGELERDPILDAAAQMKADDMVRREYFSHTGPQAQNSWHWFTSAGYFYTNAAENLAMNFNDPVALQRAWMASPTHRANILREVYTEVGVGIAHGMYHGEPATFVVQFFATPAGRYFAHSFTEPRRFQSL